MKKRVLLVARILDSGGVTTHMFSLAKGLMSIGWEVAIASRGQVGEHSYSPEWFESNGIKHFYIPFPEPSLSFKNIVRVVKAYFDISSVVNTFSPNLIHVHWRATSPYVHLVTLLHKIPYVTSLHLQGIPANFIYKLASFWGNRAIVVSAETSDYLVQKFQIPRSSIRVVHLGVDESYFYPPTQEQYEKAREKFGLSQNDKVVSILARLEAVKGHDVLIKALALLRARGCNVRALFAGEGSQAQALAQLAAKEGVADLVRQIGYADSREVLWASDVSALPSRNEGFGLVVVESMLCKVVPVRTPAAGAYDQIEDGVNGFITPFDNYEALATRLQQLLTDRKLKNRMAEAALVTAKNKFTQRVMLEKTVAVYEEVL
ncbi:glycosyl transferase, group 1 family protein [Calothrix sp. NIES-4071]|nr:glycosyl transferase, group 1 family protein [Calothrix sp. NIES-4071]BAZ58976.1 glycosyl transferase, group 1 family protein [Calothrix sp. NIES-4105]